MIFDTVLRLKLPHICDWFAPCPENSMRGYNDYT
jgi:hypothetical protein